MCHLVMEVVWCKDEDGIARVKLLQRKFPGSGVFLIVIREALKGNIHSISFRDELIEM